jgi:hypothetical protein
MKKKNPFTCRQHVGFQLRHENKSLTLVVW